MDSGNVSQAYIILGCCQSRYICYDKRVHNNWHSPAPSSRIGTFGSGNSLEESMHMCENSIRDLYLFLDRITEDVAGDTHHFRHGEFKVLLIGRTGRRWLYPLIVTGIYRRTSSSSAYDHRRSRSNCISNQTLTKKGSDGLLLTKVTSCSVRGR